MLLLHFSDTDHANFPHFLETNYVPYVWYSNYLKGYFNVLLSMTFQVVSQIHFALFFRAASTNHFSPLHVHTFSSACIGALTSKLL